MTTPDPIQPILLVAPDGARAEIYPNGAHVAAWQPAGDTERLFLSQASGLYPGAAIRGGVPVIFPQFGGLGDLPKHGFARVQPWKPSSPEIDPGAASMRLSLQDTEATRQLWPYAFRAALDVTLGGPRLELTLSVTNAGHEPFTFTAALHTYFRVEDIQSAAVEGLQGVRYHDTTLQAWGEAVQEEPEVRFSGEVDRIYYNVPNLLTLRDSSRQITIHSAGFPDAVVWNPGPAKSSRLPDMEPDGYRRFVCIEAAAIGRPVSLEPGQSWQGTQMLIAG